MGSSKSDLFHDRENRLSGMMKAMAHPARVLIVEHLLEVDDCICNDLVELLPLSQPTVSRHLKVLRDVGLIKGKIMGNSICYSVDSTALSLLLNYFNDLAVKWELRNHSI